MIRFSAALVVVAVGALITGVAISSLLLVYVAIGISAAALLVLAAGVVLKRDELFATEARSAGVMTNPAETGSSARAAAPAQDASAGGASQPRVAAGVGGSAYRDPVFGDSVFRDTALKDTAFGDTPFGDWASTRPAQQSPAPVQQADDGTSGRLGAWPPPAFGSPAAPAAGDAVPPGLLPPGTLPSGTPSPIPPASLRRPPAPPTRADPVLPWSDSLPTRVDIGGTPAGSTSAPGQPAFGNLQPGEAATSATPRAPIDDAESLSARSSGGQFAWRDITWDEDASDEPGVGEQDSGELDHSARDSSHDWLSGDDGDGLTYDVGSDHAAASGFTEDAEAAADAETDGIDLVATAALDIPPGLGADTSPDLGDADTGRDAWASLDADTGTNPDADASTDLNGGSDTGRDAWMRLDAETGTALDAAADPDVELPGAPDDDDSAHADSGLPSDGSATAVPSATGQVMVVPGVPRYHEENCILIRFMDDGDVQRMTVPEAEKAGCTPCRACQSED